MYYGRHLFISERGNIAKALVFTSISKELNHSLFFICAGIRAHLLRGEGDEAQKFLPEWDGQEL